MFSAVIPWHEGLVEDVWWQNEKVAKQDNVTTSGVEVDLSWFCFDCRHASLDVLSTRCISKFKCCSSYPRFKLIFQFADFFKKEFLPPSKLVGDRAKGLYECPWSDFLKSDCLHQTFRQQQKSLITYLIILVLLQHQYTHLPLTPSHLLALCLTASKAHAVYCGGGVVRPGNPTPFSICMRCIVE